MDPADPTWPLFVLAAIQLGDAVASYKPMRFAADCFDDVNVPREFWWVFTPIKLAAAAGLIVGAWVPEIGLAACLGLVLYYLLAIRRTHPRPRLRPEPLRQRHGHASPHGRGDVPVLRVVAFDP